MENLLGKISAELIEQEPTELSTLVEKINSNIKPPQEITSDDVYIRAMHVVSDQVNSYGGCFPEDEHDKLIGLLIDSPVLIGHRKDRLPIARNFHAETIQKENVNWVKVYFYWLRSAKHGEDLKKNIDGGIYKECSISFVFNFPECSVCGEDIRDCKHRPFEEYDTTDGTKVAAHFNYRQILKVLETSLVYRGSMNNTSITDELCFTKIIDESSASSDDNGDIKQSEGNVYRVWDPESLEKEKKYYIMPAYEALPVRLHCHNNEVGLYFSDGCRIESEKISEQVSKMQLPPGEYKIDCRLIGYQGKERQETSEVLKFIDGGKSAVRRVELKIADLIEYENESCFNLPGRERQTRLREILGENNSVLIPVKEISGEQLPDAVAKYSTRVGLEILAVDSPARYLFTHKKLLPTIVTKQEQLADGYIYSFSSSLSSDRLMIKNKISSKINLEMGTAVEIETAGIEYDDGEIKLIRPKLKSVHNFSRTIDDVSLLIDHERLAPGTNEYKIYEMEEGVTALVLMSEGKVSAYRISGFSMGLLDSGRYFLADRLNRFDFQEKDCISYGKIEGSIEYDDARKIKCAGQIDETLVIRTAIIKGVERHVLYKSRQQEREVE